MVKAQKEKYYGHYDRDGTDKWSTVRSDEEKKKRRGLDYVEESGGTLFAVVMVIIITTITIIITIIDITQSNQITVDRID